MSHIDDGHLQLTRTGFNPTVDDVLHVRRILAGLGINKPTLPMELVLTILSFASYYPRQSNVKRVEVVYKANKFWRPGPEASVAGLYLTVSTPSMPVTSARVKSITFQMRAADQGWATFGGNGTYDNSHTWFEASILRPQTQSQVSDHNIIPPDYHVMSFPASEDARDSFSEWGYDMVERDGSVVWRVHNNITACGEYRPYKVQWVAGSPTEIDDPRAMGDGQGFLELLRPDDVVALWARAEQQAWVIKVQEATMEIEYEVL